MPEPVGGRTGVGAGGRPWRCREEGLPGWPHLIKQGDVEGEPEAVLERDLVGQRIAELLGRGRRVRQQRLGGPVHERHSQHDGLLGLGGLKVTQEASWDPFTSEHLTPSGLPAPSGDGALRPKRPTAHCLSLVTGAQGALLCSPPERTCKVPELGH